MDVAVSRLIALAFVIGSDLGYLLYARGTPPTPQQVREAIKRAEERPEGVRKEIHRVLGFVPSWCRSTDRPARRRSSSTPPNAPAHAARRDDAARKPEAP